MRCVAVAEPDERNSGDDQKYVSELVDRAPEAKGGGVKVKGIRSASIKTEHS